MYVVLLAVNDLFKNSHTRVVTCYFWKFLYFVIIFLREIYSDRKGLDLFLKIFFKHPIKYSKSKVNENIKPYFRMQLLNR
ncbi:MAG: hypothetical protein CMH75_00775 [Nitrospina sp.]|nr:hypothetical protein [Nitrospina sp.]